MAYGQEQTNQQTDKKINQNELLEALKPFAKKENSGEYRPEFNINKDIVILKDKYYKEGRIYSDTNMNVDMIYGIDNMGLYYHTTISIFIKNAKNKIK